MSQDAPAGPGGVPRELLGIDIDDQGGELRAVLRGELDESTAPKLISRISEAVAGGRDLVIDAGGLTFCGSAGLSAFILIERSVTAGGGALTVTQPTPFLVELLTMAGIDGLIGPAPGA